MLGDGFEVRSCQFFQVWKLIEIPGGIHTCMEGRALRLRTTRRHAIIEAVEIFEDSVNDFGVFLIETQRVASTFFEGASLTHGLEETALGRYDTSVNWKLSVTATDDEIGVICVGQEP